MRKSILALLMALFTTFALGAVGCNEPEEPTPPSADGGTTDGDNTGNDNTDDGADDGTDDGEQDGDDTPAAQTYTVTLNGGEGYKIVSDSAVYNQAANKYTATVEEGSTFTFALELGVFYTGNPTITAGGVVLSETDGQYSVTVSANTEVVIDGIRKDQSNMLGTGAFDNAYVVSRPIDLVYIAEQVNSGKGNYATAAYVLANDIDCGGEEIGVIGTEENPFSGCFTCLTNPETGEMERFAISNFKINSTDKNYVGLFGCVQVDMSVSSSGLFYGIRVDNFEINASTVNLPKFSRNIYCGGLLGYGLGARMYLCDATNGTINVSADPTEFSFAGGLVGVQQSYYMPEYNQFFTAETAYATVDVDVNIVSGTTLYAGGIAGYLYTNSFMTPAYIHNSYATGNVSGAIRTGGIAGGLGQYSSVATSYSSGNVTANVALTADTDGYLPEHCIAYAGGIVGFAENDTVVNDCFSTGTITAHAADGPSAEKTGYAIGGGDEDGKISVASRKYVIRDCKQFTSPDGISSTLKNMGWQTYNWVLSDTAYPIINYAASEESVTVKTVVEFVDKNGDPVSVKSKTSTDYSYTDTYAPIASAFVDGFLDLYLTADDGKSLSFGYYFDKECTDPVPYSYITTRESILYMGFTDPSEIVGKYTLAVKGSNKQLTVEILADGTTICSDGASYTTANYQYDGETLIIEGARLARYFTGKVDKTQSVNEDTLFDMYRYDTYYFKAVKDGNVLKLYDGTYFTESAPLTAYAYQDFLYIGAYYTYDGTTLTEYVFLPDGTGTKNNQDITYVYSNDTLYIDGEEELNVSALQEYDELKGSWQKSAFVDKVFTFNGVNSWSAYTNVYTRDYIYNTASREHVDTISGKYEKIDDTTYLLKDRNNTNYATVTIDEFGFLAIEYASGATDSYRADNGFTGTWTDGDITLELEGLNAKGTGNAVATFKSYGYTYNLTYSISETLSPNPYLCLYYEETLFGYFTHNKVSNTLQATLFDPMSMEGEYVLYTLKLVNSFNSVWISDNTMFDDISFSGTGRYNENGDWLGEVTIQNTKVPYTLEKGGLNGYFSYQGTRYLIEYNDIRNEIIINTDTTLKQKDDFVDKTFVSVNNSNQITTITFDGKSQLIVGGEMKVTFVGESSPTEYNYKANGDGTYTIYDNGSIVGSIVKNESKACYDITISGVLYPTYIRNEFMGSWAMSGEFQDNMFIIGATDLNGEILATFQGEEVRIKKIDTDYYSFYCELEGMPVTYYLYVLYDEDTKRFDSFALSEYTSLVYGNYILCSIVDAVQGTWIQNNNPDFSISFDGVQSSYSNGTATLSYKGNPTPYYYRIYKDSNGNVESVMLWSQNTYSGKTLYYKLTPTETTTAGAFVLGDRAFIRTEIDALYKMSAKGADGYTYTFNGENLNDSVWGTITATKDGEPTKTFTYDIVSFNSNQTATITVKEVVAGVEITYTATLNYSDSNNITISFVEQ